MLISHYFFLLPPNASAAYRKKHYHTIMPIIFMWSEMADFQYC